MKRQKRKRMWKYLFVMVLLLAAGGISAEAAEETQTGAEIVLTPEQANEYGYYHADVKVGIAVKNVPSGIKSVEYRITSDAQNTASYQELYACAEGEELRYSYEGSLLVKAEENDSADVKIWLRVTGQSGAVYTTEESEVCSLKICTVRPRAEVSVDGILHREAEAGYYNTGRKAVVTVFDRADVFDEKAASQAILIGKDGVELSRRPDMVSAWISEGDRHSAVITFAEDGVYEWQMSGYKNRAGLSCTEIDSKGDTPYRFTIDTEPPLTSDTPDKAASWIGYGETGWSKLAGTLRFGAWERGKVTVGAEGRDAVSPVYAAKYYKTEGKENPALERAALDALYEKGDFTEEPYTIEAEGQFVIYARITDYAGNTAYISTEGIIVDKTAGQVKLRVPEAPNAAGFYRDDVQIEVCVNDLLGDQEAYSGIKSIDYVINNPLTQYTETGNLYTFDKKTPEKAELKKEWAEKKLTVDAGKFDASKVTVTVTAVDNAGNESADSLRLDICKNAPEVTVAFHDTANKEAGGRGYFGQARRAVVTVRDRGDIFDAEALKIQVRAVDAQGAELPLDKTRLLGDWRHEGDVHTAELTFSAEGNYEFSLSYKNKAGVDGNVSYTGTTPQRFTVDTTAPEGTVTIKDHTWSELLSALSFGLYSNTKADVTATAEDAVSPVEIEYYKTDNPQALTVSELDGKRFEPYPENGFTVSKDEQLVIYLKVTDYAGNRVYLNSDGYIVDMVQSRVLLLPETANKNGIYRQDVKVAVKVNDPEPYSGIKDVRYEVRNGGRLTQSGKLYVFEKERPMQSELMGIWESSILVDARKNNSCDVVLSVFVKDNAGNETAESLLLDIDVTPPEIEIIYDKQQGYRGSRYFAAPRTAVIKITERTHHFDERAASEGIKIQAVDRAGGKVNVGRISMEAEWKTEEGETPDESVHTAVLTYAADGNYTVSVSYKDRAGNANTPVDTGASAFPWKFTIDTAEPVGAVTAKKRDGKKGTRRKTWENELPEDLRIGFWSGKTITVTGRAADATSPIESVSYYKTSRRTMLTEKELKNLAAGKWRDFRGKSVKIVPNEQAVIYVRITDRAGNVSYISSGGILADKDRPRLEAFAPQVTLQAEQPVNGFYRGDVTVKLTVRDYDQKTGKIYSGLKTVRYEVLNMGEKTQGGIRDGAPEGLLYSFQKEAPRQSELKKSWSGRIQVDSRKNNSNQVMIKVYAEDNAGNVTVRKRRIKIDVTPPEISVSYDNNTPDSGKYYNADRTATITVTERNFNAKDVAVVIRNPEGSVPSVSGWKETKGSGNGDDTKHTATIVYHADGDYTFGIEYTDLAGNRCPGAVYEAGTANPEEFTIDQIAPVIQVSYDNDHAENGKYFKERRTGTVTVTEHNFDESRVKFMQTASLRGRPIAVPQASWSSSGDVHKAVFCYEEDGDYTFDAVLTDLAGNQSTGVSYGDSAAGAEFTVDTGIEELEIGGVENGKSYPGALDPFISYEDVNLAGEEIRLLRTRRGEKDVDVTEEFLADLQRTDIGASCLLHTFEKTEENDGIYTLYVKISDLAGNEKTEKITFTVNRFGSVYVFDDDLLSLRDTYTQKVRGKLVITEYNPDRLVENSLDIQITRDGIPLENVKYTVAPAVNESVKKGESGWYQYKYEIDTENFEEDGVYKLSVASEDTAGNKSETINSGNGELLFRVDTTPPEIADITGLEKAVVNGKSQEVGFDVFDAMGLKQITVYVDGVKAGRYRKFTDMIRYSGSLTIQEGRERKVRFVAEDLAGNITDTDAKDKNGRYIFQPEFAFVRDITVSTSMFVRWWAYRKSLWAVFAGIAAGGILWRSASAKSRIKPLHKF